MIFKKNNPLNIKIGFGKGDFIISLAKKYLNQNFLAIERYPLVLVLKKIIPENLVVRKKFRFWYKNYSLF